MVRTIRSINLLILSLLVGAHLHGEPQAASEEEALHLRRIAHFYQEQEHQLVITEVEGFLDSYPESAFRDHSLAMLGDAALSQGYTEQAAAAYGKIESKSPDIRGRWLKALYRERRYEEVEAAAKGEETPTVKLYLAYVLTERGEFDRAERMYHQLLQTPVAVPARLGLAELYRKSGREALAAEQYRMLAKDDTGDQHSFRAAVMQMESDPASAIAAFRMVQKGQGPSAEKAAIQEAILLSKLHKYRELIEREESISSVISENRQLPFALQLARAHAAVENFEEALNRVKRVISGESGPHHQAALLIGVAIAGELTLLDLVDEWTERFESLYPLEPERPQALFLRAMAYKSAGKFDVALSIFDEILKDYASAPQAEDAAFERSAIFMRKGDYGACREGYLTLLKLYPEGKYLSAAYQGLITASLSRLKGGSEELSEEILSQAMEDLNLVTTAEGDPSYLLKGAKIFLNSAQPSASMELVNKFLNDNSNHPLAGEAYLLLARAHYRLGDQSQFINYGERALQQNAGLRDAEQLHRNLFSVYLRTDGDEEKAVDHLHAAFQLNPNGCSEQQLAWLVEHLAADDALVVFSRLLDDKSFAAGEDVVLESAALEYSEALLRQQNIDVAHRVLSSLYQSQKDNPDWKWQHQARTRVLFARVLAEQGASNEAMSLLKAGRVREPWAQLLQAQLGYREIPSNQQKTDSEQVTEVLATLRRVSARRSMETEPAHLEAAFDYAAIKAHLSDTPNKVLADELETLKQTFADRSDLLTREYHRKRSEVPEKEILYQAYMMLADARLTYLTANSNERRLEAVRAILTTLREGKYAVTPYIVIQAERGLAALDDRSFDNWNPIIQ